MKSVKYFCLFFTFAMFLKLSLLTAYAANTQTANDFYGRMLSGDDINWDGSNETKDKKYDDPWPWWRNTTWRHDRYYPWRRSSGRGPSWGSPPIGSPVSDSFKSADSKADKQAKQDYEEEIYQRVLRDEWAKRKRRRFPTFPNRNVRPADKLPGPPAVPGPGFDDATLVAMGYKDWYDTFGLPIPGWDIFVSILKPNIYLYSDMPLEVTVVFTYPELLTVSIPDYDDGWKVGITQEGTLRDTNGSYEFLFYESISSLSDFQTANGFRLGIENRERQFNEILDLYCFNETEKADFIEFWTDVLESDRVYVMYPQLTARLDNAMPLVANPQPDNAFRLWFGFEAADKNPDAPDIEKISRGGLTLVEWGGFIIP